MYAQRREDWGNKKRYLPVINLGFSNLPFGRHRQAEVDFLSKWLTGYDDDMTQKAVIVLKYRHRALSLQAP